MIKKNPKLSLPSLSTKAKASGKPHPLKTIVDPEELISLIQQMRREVNGLAPEKGISYSAELGTTLFFDTNEVIDFKISITSLASSGSMGFTRSVSSYIPRQECTAELTLEADKASVEIQNLCFSPSPRKFTALINMYKDGILLKKISLYNAYITEFKTEMNSKGDEIYHLTIQPDHWIID